jgi:hypothetical protein
MVEVVVARAKSRKARAIAATVHDRRARDLPWNASVITVTVADPYNAGDKIDVTRSLRDDPLARMAARGQIDRVELEAGRHWQTAYERVEIGGATAIDLTREYVDGGRMQEPFTDQQKRAANDLNRARKAITAQFGTTGERVVRYVLAERMSIRDVAAAMGTTEASQGDLKFYGRTLREALRTLAVVFGLATHRHPRREFRNGEAVS